MSIGRRQESEYHKEKEIRAAERVRELAGTHTKNDSSLAFSFKLR